MTTDEARRATIALAEPFDPAEVKWKPQMVKNARALAVAYVDARVVQDRLDEVLGVDGWQDEFTLIEGGAVCKLTCRIGTEWVSKTDIGSVSEQPDGGDRVKAAFSDAFKRAAVKFGVARYLYRLPSQWVDYDAPKRAVTRPPQLPDWALPAGLKVKRIDRGQRQEILDLLAMAKVKLSAVLDHYKLVDLDDLPAEKFGEVVDRLKARVTPALGPGR